MSDATVHCISRAIKQIEFVTSGVFKGRRARHLPRVPSFWGPPLTCYAHKFSLILVKNLLSTHIMCCKADHKQILCFQRAPYRNCNVHVLCFQKGPNSNCSLKVICFQRGPQQPLKCVSTLLLNFIERDLHETVVCKYLAFKGAPNSNCIV